MKQDEMEQRRMERQLRGIPSKEFYQINFVKSQQMLYGDE